MPGDDPHAAVRACRHCGHVPPRLKRGRCRTCYSYWWRHGTERPLPTPTAPPGTAEHFWAKVDQTGDCWLWTAGRFDNGYGAYQWQGRPHTAQRVAYLLTHGPVPPDQYVLQRCGERRCVRPEHLSLSRVQAHSVAQPGERNRSAKLTWAQVRAIRARYAAGRATQDTLAARYGVSQKDIWCIVHGHTWHERLARQRRPPQKPRQE